MFNDQDFDTRQPVAIVNAAFAKKHFGTESALNRRFRPAGNPGPPSAWRTIVGVVVDGPDVRAVQQSRRRRLRLLRAVLCVAHRPDAADAARQPVRDCDRAATRRTDRAARQQPAARSREDRSESAALLRRHAENPARGLRRAEPDHRGDVHDVWRSRGRARRRRHLRRDVVLGQSADAGVRCPDGAWRRRAAEF